MFKTLLSLALTASVSLSAFADEASVKKALESKLGAKVTSVTKSPYLEKRIFPKNTCLALIKITKSPYPLDRTQS